MSQSGVRWAIMGPLTLAVFAFGVLGGFTALQTACMMIGPWAGYALRGVVDRRR